MSEQDYTDALTKARELGAKAKHKLDVLPEGHVYRPLWFKIATMCGEMEGALLSRWEQPSENSKSPVVPSEGV